MTRSITLAISLLLAAVAAQGADESSRTRIATLQAATGQHSAAAAATPDPARPSLAGTSWVLATFQSMDDTSLTPSAAERYTLTFGADGSLVLQVACNRGRGTWRSPDNVSIEFGPAALTRAACPPSPLERRFARDLGYVRSYIVGDGKLHLSLMADGGIYTFEPQKPGAKQ